MWMIRFTHGGGLPLIIATSDLRISSIGVGSFTFIGWIPARITLAAAVPPMLSQYMMLTPESARTRKSVLSSSSMPLVSVLITSQSENPSLETL